MLVVKDLVKLTFIILLIIFILFVLIREILDDRPIKFEYYKNNGAFEHAMQERFPVGSDVDEAIAILVKSDIEGIGIHHIVNKADQQRWNIKEGTVYFCYYYARIVSFSPLAKYAIEFVADKERKILSMYAYREPFLAYFWW